MHFVLDENAPAPLLADIIALGHDASSILEYLDEGAPDSLVAATCDQLGAVILSCNSDFRSLISRRTSSSAKRLRNVHLVHMKCKDRRVRDRFSAAIPRGGLRNLNI